MENFPDLHRRSLRLRDYDYSQAGAYFITICTQNRECLFGEIKKGETILNKAGRMVQSVRDELSGRFPTVELDELVVMPNHIHGIIVLVGEPLVGARGCVEEGESTKNRADPRPTPTLGDIVCAFKSITTGKYIFGVKNHGWPPFVGKLWQRNYYEHIIRNEPALNIIREYIAANPMQWELDSENPLVDLDSERRKKDRAVEKDFGQN